MKLPDKMYDVPLPAGPKSKVGLDEHVRRCGAQDQ